MTDQTRTCTNCGETKPLDDFRRERRVKSGRTTECRTCLTERSRAWTAAHPGYKTEVNRRTYARYPGRQKARSRINYLVSRGRIPAATTLACLDCGKPAAQYDHARGYEPPNDLYVEPVCLACHGRRHRKDGQHGG